MAGLGDHTSNPFTGTSSIPQCAKAFNSGVIGCLRDDVE